MTIHVEPQIGHCRAYAKNSSIVEGIRKEDLIGFFTDSGREEHHPLVHDPLASLCRLSPTGGRPRANRASYSCLHDRRIRKSCSSDPPCTACGWSKVWSTFSGRRS